jgi:hypothetical protein
LSPTSPPITLATPRAKADKAKTFQDTQENIEVFKNDVNSEGNSIDPTKSLMQVSLSPLIMQVRLATKN